MVKLADEPQNPLHRLTPEQLEAIDAALPPLAALVEGESPRKEESA